MNVVNGMKIMDFKFLQSYQKKPLFQFEITNDITRTGNICWTREYSDVIRKWVSDLYFENRYSNPMEYFKYFSIIDRTCELMETPRIIDRQNNCSLFSVSVKIWGTDAMWMIAELSYPIDHVIYR